MLGKYADQVLKEYKVYAVDVIVGPKLESLIREGARTSEIDVTSKDSVGSTKPLIKDETLRTPRHCGFICQ